MVYISFMEIQKDYYNILEVSREATSEEIKRAYRRLALKFHPDRNTGDPDAEDHFKEITEAYGVLIDPAKRRIYNFDNVSKFDQESVFNDIFSNSNYRDVFSDLPIKRDWIEKFFNIGKVIIYEAIVYGGRPRDILRRSILRMAVHGASKIFHNVMDIHHTITITPDIALRGGHITVEYKPGFSPKRIQVGIPPNIKNGTVLRLSNVGRKNPAGKAGDLYLHVEVISS